MMLYEAKSEVVFADPVFVRRGFGMITRAVFGIAAAPAPAPRLNVMPDKEDGVTIATLFLWNALTTKPLSCGRHPPIPVRSSATP
jgi:hypothetical protein